MRTGMHGSRGEGTRGPDPLGKLQNYCVPYQCWSRFHGKSQSVCDDASQFCRMIHFSRLVCVNTGCALLETASELNTSRLYGLILLYIVVKCQFPCDPSNGEVSFDMSNVRVGDMAWYTCDYDFILNGPEERTCEGNGTWSGPEPTCTPVGKYIPRDV